MSVESSDSFLRSPNTQEQCGYFSTSEVLLTSLHLLGHESHESNVTGKHEPLACMAEMTTFPMSQGNIQNFFSSIYIHLFYPCLQYSVGKSPPASP